MSIVLLLLAATAGAGDAISYVSLGHVFTANMTGNTVLFGLALGRLDLQGIIRAFTSICGYFSGVFGGTILLGNNQPKNAWTPPVARLVKIETLTLIVFTVIWYMVPRRDDVIVHVLIALSALAMGLQSAAARQLNIPGVMTTYMTGTLTSIAGTMADRLRLKLPPPEPYQLEQLAEDRRRLRLQCGIWFAYWVAAAIIMLLTTYTNFAVLMPTLGLLSVIVLTRKILSRQ